MLPVALTMVTKAVPQKLLAPPSASDPFAVGVIAILLCQLVVALLYLQVAIGVPPPASTPAPSTAAPVVWLLATVIFLSLVVIVLELMVVVVPLTVKLPATTASAAIYKLAPFTLPVALTMPVT